MTPELWREARPGELSEWALVQRSHADAGGMVLVPVRDRTWYCDRFGVSGYDPDICERYGHLKDGHKCGYYWLVAPGEDTE